MNCKKSHCFPLKKNHVVQRSLDLRLRGAQARNYLKICCVNVFFLLLLLLDTWKVGYFSNRLYYCDYLRVIGVYSIATVMALSALACFGKYLWLICGDGQVIGTESQRCLLDGSDGQFSLGSTYTTYPINKFRFPLRKLLWNSLYTSCFKSTEKQTGSRFGCQAHRQLAFLLFGFLLVA